ncbi:MAG: hypothetical protein ACTSV6_00025, partial [Candidatus Heimdallarchaeota archaeon]
ITVFCNDPVKPLKNYTVKILTPPPATIQKVFTASPPKPTLTATGYKYSLDYDNNYGIAYLVFFFTNSSGHVVYFTDPFIIGPGSGTKEVNFMCTNRMGGYFVSWTAYSDIDLTDPLPKAWAKSIERGEFQC